MKKGDIIKKVSLLGVAQEFTPPIVAKVNWIIDGQVSAQSLEDPKGFHLFAEGDTDWKIIQESAPTFQSQVENLSDDELRASIDALRAGRAPLVSAKVPKAPKVEKAPAQTEEEKKLMALMALLSPEEQQKLRTKLGM